MANSTHHVVPSKNGWSVVREGANRASVNTETKAEAIKIGRVISLRQGTRLVVHGSDGKIQRADK
ncbi:MAG TPA: DUF2188 domain-containing protein [Clostridia bacterium]|nr:DUF2188 domain-containing protein [Clostridia bacterium]